MADADQLGEANSAEAQTKLQAAIEDGVLKIVSKMGISTVDGYRGAQIFEALGLAAEVIDACLRGRPRRSAASASPPSARTPSRRHDDAFGADEAELDSPGFVRFRKGGEYHANHPDAIEALHSHRGAGSEAESAAARTTTTNVIFLDDHRPDAGRPPSRRAARPPTCSSGPSPTAGPTSTTRSPSWSTTRPTTELHDLLEFVPAGRARPARRGRAGGGHHPPVLHRGDVARLAVGRGPRDARHRHEHGRRQEQLRRGRREPPPLPHPGHGRGPQLPDQADRLRPLRRDARVLRLRRRAQHQDGPGLQARRGRPAARATR